MDKTLGVRLITWTRNFVNFFTHNTKHEIARFRVYNSLKMTSIPIISMLVLWSLLYTLLTMDLIFFKANGYPGTATFEETFFDYMMSSLIDYLPYVGGFIILLIFVGIYISDLIIRPFRLIGDYCEKFVEGKDASYDPDFFSDLKLLTSFSEYFFSTIENGLKNKNLKPIEIPSKYTRIHKPGFETGFFLQYFLFILITSICVSLAIYFLMVEVHSQVLDFSFRVLKEDATIRYFLNQQSIVLNNIIIVVSICHLLLYVGMALHLYARVAPPAFGFFSTMRSFIKGQYNARVHLLGYSYVRPQSRKLNKYLSYIQSKIEEQNRKDIKTN